MADARLVRRRRLLRAGAALAVLPALFSFAATDAARADVVPSAPAVAAPAPAPTTEPISEPAPEPTTEPATGTPTLRLGSRGADVLRLQRRLRELGYDVGKVNSSFGDDTLHAVRAFQKVQRTSVTGVVTAAVWTRLRQPVVPRARYTSSRTAVEVDLTRRVLYLTQGGTVTAVFDVSPGKPSTPTVRGRFTIYRRINSWHHGPLGGLYRPNYFHRGFALHGSESVPAYAASHGCVRLTTAGMDRLYPLLSIGEYVSVYRG